MNEGILSDRKQQLIVDDICATNYLQRIAIVKEMLKPEMWADKGVWYVENKTHYLNKPVSVIRGIGHSPEAAWSDWYICFQKGTGNNLPFTYSTISVAANGVAIISDPMDCFNYIKDKIGLPVDTVLPIDVLRQYIEQYCKWLTSPYDGPTL